MFTHLTPYVQDKLLLATDQIQILATYERREHREPWELPLPEEVENSKGKGKAAKDGQPDAMRCTESHMVSCHQSGLTRKHGFQGRFFHPEFALRAALDKVGIDPNLNSERVEQRPLNVFEPVTKHGMVVIVRQLEEIGNKLVDVTSIVNEPPKNLDLFGIKGYDCQFQWHPRL